MRTTIQLAEDQKARLQRLAAERGERGCSRVVQEAVTRYLAELERPTPPAGAPVAAPSSPPPAPEALVLSVLSETQREELRALAAARGDEDLTPILREAVTHYLMARRQGEGVPTRTLIGRAFELVGLLCQTSIVGVEIVVRSVRVRLGRAAA